MSQASKKFDLDFLRDKGFFREVETVKGKDEYSQGNEVEYLYDSKNKIAYFDNFNRDEIPEIVKGLKRRKNFDYYWFWEEGRVCAFRTFGENKQFIYNLDHSLGSEWVRGKQDKLRNFSPSNPDILFEVKEVIDRFYSNLWNLRIKLAESIEEDIGENEKIMTAQRLIDRLIFIYFLGEKGIVKGIDKTGNTLDIDVKKLFNLLLEKSEDFHETLNQIFFQYLNNKKKSDMPISGSEGFSLYIPYLNGGLFREKILETSDGTLKESNLEIKNFEWKELIDELNNYNWIIEEFQAQEEENVFGNLTPEVLGHIYEKFVISVSELKDFSIKELKTTEKGDLKKGNKKIGAYYTPEDVTRYITENTIFSFLKSKLGVNNAENFQEFYERYGDDEKTLKNVGEALSDISVLDPAVGSGHFLMSAAELLADWRKKCGYNGEDYSLRRDIIINNLFGVDIMEGAVEICKLRLWLWLIASQKHGEDPEPLPNIEFNIREGNSLIGFAEKKATVGKNESLFTHEFKNKLQEYKEKVERYKKSHNGAQKLKSRLDELNSKMQEQLNDWYIKTTDLRTGEELNNLHDVLQVIDKHTKPSGRGDIQINLKFGQDISDETKEALKSLGLRVWSKKATLNIKTTDISSKKLSNIAKKVETEELDDISLERDLSVVDLEQLNPFHWVMEFPSIFDNEEGFDVTIGNPPYGRDVLSAKEKVFLSNYKADGCGDISGYFLEREFQLTKKDTSIGNVMAGSLAVNKSMTPVRDLMEDLGDFRLAFFGTRPAKLFPGNEERVCIIIGTKGNPSPIKTAKNFRLTKERRSTLFKDLEFTSSEGLVLGSGIGQRENNEETRLPKLGSSTKRDILLKLKEHAINGRKIGDVIGNGDYKLRYRSSAGYWLTALKDFPYSSTMVKDLIFNNKTKRDLVLIILNSSLYYTFWTVYGNNRHVFRDLIDKFPLPSREIMEERKEEIETLAEEIDECLRNNFDPDTGRMGEFNAQMCKQKIDEIDDLLGELYGFESNQIEFIKTYDSHIRKNALSNCS